MRRRTRINPVSDRRRKRDREYHDARVAVWERGEGRCEFVGPEGQRCWSEMADPHHIEGRNVPDPHALHRLIGLCRFHHSLAHQNPEWARAVGLMRSRLATESVRSGPSETDRTTSGDAA